LLRLVDGADVFVHNIRPQKLEPLGLGSDMLCRRNPRLIYAGIHGWREDGPYSGRPAYDDIIQGLCGVASLMDRLTGEPRYAPTILCDKTSGLVAAQSILAALYSRERTGRGQFIEIPMFETMVAFIMVEHLLRSAPGRGGLCAGAGAVAEAVSHGGWLSLHAGLHRRAVAAVLGRGRPAGDDGGPAICRHRGAEPQHR
jgi:crotonobetainyl-CoA:carnitine CoA-transferase CaiB-like acyl-CoA transferase